MAKLKELFKGFHALSRKVMKDLIPDMIKTNRNSQQLMKDNGHLKLMYKNSARQRY
ncbi:MAG: hypothetical protein ACK5NF_02670 [Bacilli bacterium]